MTAFGFAGDVSEGSGSAKRFAHTGAVVRRLQGGAPLLLVRGAGALAALHRLVSQDVAGLGAGATARALLLSPKGRCRFPLLVGRVGEDVVLLGPEGSGDALRASLGRYLALSRLGAEPFFPAGAAAEILGAGWPGVLVRAGLVQEHLAEAGVAVTAAEGRQLVAFGRTVEGRPGATLVAEDGQALDVVLGRLAAVGVEDPGEEAVEVARIVAGFPRWGKEITEDALPQEVGLADGWVSLAKGCYPGQETMARLRTYGHVNRALTGLRQLDGVAEPPPLPLELRDVDTGSRRGVLTSWGRHPQLGGVGLGLVRREVAAGSCLAGAERRFQVVPLPLLPGEAAGGLPEPP